MFKALYILVCYLYGSLPVTEVLAKKKGTNLRKVGTGNVGAGNLWQTSGAMSGMIGGAFDVGKGALPAMVAGVLGLGKGVGCAGSVAGLIAQMWPVFKKFDGGRGNSSAIGLALTAKSEVVPHGAHSDACRRSDKVSPNHDAERPDVEAAYEVPQQKHR